MRQGVELTATGAYVKNRPNQTPDVAVSGSLPELQNLRWTDTFFDDDDDIVAVFDFDYDAMEDYNTQVACAGTCCLSIFPPALMIMLLCLHPCFLRKNVEWNTRCQHVAVTRDGIRYVQDRHPSCCGLGCTDQGKNSKTVPFDKITDCDVQEPAGNTCLCVPNILNVVKVDTASSGPEGQKELELAGLKEPFAFKKLVWAMKRQQSIGGTTSTSLLAPRKGNSPATTMAQQAPASSYHMNDDVTTLLRDIRDDLRTNNALILSVIERDQR